MDTSLNDDASVIRDMAWRQIDTHNSGYIYARDFDLLIDAIDSILNRPLLNEQGRAIIKDFTKRDAHNKITKSEFKHLFETLTGISFKKALDVLDFDKNIIETERKSQNKRMNHTTMFGDYDNSDTIKKIPVLTSTPVSKIISDPILQSNNDSISTSQLIDPPNFKKEFSRYKTLYENKEDEIKYRDELIESLQRDEPNLKKFEMKMTDLKRKNNSLEDEVSYRDDIILKKDEELIEKLEIIRRLDKSIVQLKKELNIYKSENKLNIKNLQDEKKAFFNQELLKRIKTQQIAIENLKNALSKNTELVKTIPISVENNLSKEQQPQHHLLSNLLPFPDLKMVLSRTVILLAIIFTFSMLLCFSSNETIFEEFDQKDSWYTNTFLEPILFNFFENRDVDYDHYNLGDISIESLRGL